MQSNLESIVNGGGDEGKASFQGFGGFKVSEAKATAKARSTTPP
jgi:hypothetical protein